MLFYLPTPDLSDGPKETRADGTGSERDQPVAVFGQQTWKKGSFFGDLRDLCG